MQICGGGKKAFFGFKNSLEMKRDKMMRDRQHKTKKGLTAFRLLLCVLASNELLIVQPGRRVTAGVEKQWELTISAKSSRVESDGGTVTESKR